MSTTIALRLPWGRFHATPWDRNVNEGVVEWPPSPYRLLRALVATWQERSWTLEREVITGLLQRLSQAPPSYELPPYQLGHTRHYYPDIQHRVGNHSTDKILDAFVVTERDAELRVTWPVDLDAAERQALSTLVEALPHLGRADSICVGRVVEGDVGGEKARPLESGQEPALGQSEIRLLAPEPSATMRDLQVRPSDVRAQRLARPPATRWIPYSIPGALVSGPTQRHITMRSPTVVRWVIASMARPSAYATLAITHVLRNACQSAYGALFDRAASPQLSGKDASGQPLEGHVHAHYLALDQPKPGDSRGDRRIENLIVWVDDRAGGLDERVAAALGTLHLKGLRGHRHIPDFRPLRLGLEGVGAVEHVAAELAGPATIWESHTPFLAARHPKRRADAAFIEAEIERELRFRGLPGPTAVQLIPGDWSAYRRHRPEKERLRDTFRRPWGLRLVFDEPVKGPLCLGAMSHFGMGLFLPLPNASG